jgi:hypothetical protein
MPSRRETARWENESELRVARHLSKEGGAGERVQGARAAYGTCFNRADYPGPPLIPVFFRLPPGTLFVTSKGH